MSGKLQAVIEDVPSGLGWVPTWADGVFGSDESSVVFT